MAKLKDIAFTCHVILPYRCHNGRWSKLVTINWPPSQISSPWPPTASEYVELLSSIHVLVSTSSIGLYIVHLAFIFSSRVPQFHPFYLFPGLGLQWSGWRTIVRSHSCEDTTRRPFSSKIPLVLLTVKMYYWILNETSYADNLCEHYENRLSSSRMKLWLHYSWTPL